MTELNEPRVFLVGAGPGSPGLLTLRAAELLASADLVLYDQLVPKRLLDFVNPKAEQVCVRELPGNHPDKYPHIHSLLIEKAREGKRVVRLKGGDPLIFGRGGEEAESLRAAGIPYEIVPGVTAAIAAAAYLDMPLTHRNYSSAVALVTGHELPSKPGNRLDWAALAKFPGTLAIYMGISRLPLIIEQLLKHGRDPDSPAAIVERVSLGEMRSVYATLSTLDTARRNAGLESPGLILVGDAISRRIEQSWFQSRPLFGQRVLITRPGHQAGPFMRRLEELGAVPFRMPCIEIRPPSDLSSLDQAIREIREEQWDWIVFSSANGVRGLMDRLIELGRDARDFHRVRFAVVGPKTAECLAEYRLKADRIASSEFSADALAADLKSDVLGSRVLLVKGKQGRDLLRDELSRIATVGVAIAYEQVDSVEPAADVLDALRRGEIRFVTLTSSNIARSLIGHFDETIRGRVQRGEIEIVAISPATAQAVRDLGLPVAHVAKRATTESMIAEMIHASQTRVVNSVAD